MDLDKTLNDLSKESKKEHLVLMITKGSSTQGFLHLPLVILDSGKKLVDLEGHIILGKC